MSDNFKYRTEGQPSECRRDDEVESHVQAYIVRTSMLQLRLLSTLDTLDARDRSHERELSAVEADRLRLKVKLQQYLEFVKSAELERDDMRDAVIRLIEKVEMSNDYSKWPHSQISLSSLADPIDKQPSIRQLINEEDLLSYAASVIKTLNRERDHERRAHAKTRQASDARITELEAMLSRREAELESYVSNGSHFMSMKTHTTRPTLQKTKSSALKDNPISPEEVISILAIATTRNKILEAEVNRLAKQLEEALNRAVPPEFGCVSESSADVKNLSHADGIDKRFFESDKLIGLEKQINDLGSRIDAFVAERRILCETIGSPSLHKELPQADELHERLQQAEFECHRLKRSESLLRAQLNDTRLDAQEREAELVAKINALMLAQQKWVSVIPTEVHETRSIQIQTSPPGAIADNLLDPNDGEITMELGTPLMPTSLLTQTSHVFHLPGQLQSFDNDGLSQGPVLDTVQGSGDTNGSYVDPPSIPLPLSPDSLSAREPNSEFTISASAFPLPPPFTPRLCVESNSRNPTIAIEDPDGID